MTPAGGQPVNWSQWSVILLKPDCVERRLTTVILDWIGQVVLVSAVRTVRVTEAQIFAHYADLFPKAAEIGVDIAAGLRRIYAGRDAVIALGHSPDAPARLRALIGPTDPAAAGADTIRGRYGIDTLAAGRAEGRLIDNLIHTSDDPDAARRDFALWFGPGQAGLLKPLPPEEETTMTHVPARHGEPEPAQFGTGPARLQLMPAGQKAALDPYMAQIVTYRKSGLSLNHIIGCPLDCGYCVRHFWGDFEHKTPHLLVPTPEAVEMLTGHEAFRASTTPIQLLNKATDPFLPGVKPHLFQVLRALDERGLDNLVLIITRFTVTAADMLELERLQHVRVTLLFTFSGITDPRVEPIAKSAITTRSIATACARKNRTKVVLYWRPIVPGWNDDPATMSGVLAAGRAADAIVFTGYYHKEQNAGYLRSLGVEVPYGQDYNRRKVLPEELDARVIAAWRASGISTPLFRKTSCGVSAAHQVADYNGHWGVRELCDICPAAQIGRCHAGHRQPAPGELDTVLADLGYATDYLIDGGHVWTHGLGEQKRYAIQHTLGFQIWELDQPHLLHAHGRSLTGYQPTEQEQQELTAIRTRFTHAARFDEDD